MRRARLKRRKQASRRSDPLKSSDPPAASHHRNPPAHLGIFSLSLSSCPAREPPRQHSAETHTSCPQASWRDRIAPPGNQHGRPTANPALGQRRSEPSPYVEGVCDIGTIRSGSRNPSGAPHSCSAPPPAALLLRRLQTGKQRIARDGFERREMVEAVGIEPRTRRAVTTTYVRVCTRFRGLHLRDPVQR